MFSLNESTVREKKFDQRFASSKRTHHTMTDNYTLFNLYRNREKLDRGEMIQDRNWLRRLFRWVR